MNEDCSLLLSVVEKEMTLFPFKEYSDNIIRKWVVEEEWYDYDTSREISPKGYFHRRLPDERYEKITDKVEFLNRFDVFDEKVSNYFIFVKYADYCFSDFSSLASTIYDIHNRASYNIVLSFFLRNYDIIQKHYNIPDDEFSFKTMEMVDGTTFCPTEVFEKCGFHKAVYDVLYPNDIKVMLEKGFIANEDGEDRWRGSRTQRTDAV